MADSPPLTSAMLAVLRKNLLARAIGMRLPPEDVDEVVDRALAKAASERAPDPAISFEQRAGAAFQDVRVEYYRRRDARPEIEPDAEVPEIRYDASVHERAVFAETVQEMRAALGADVAKFAVLTCMGHSERAIGELLGWDPLRTQRVRRRFARNAPDFFRAQAERVVIHKQEAS